ncbi:MAG: hypothetical protein ACT4N4_13985, partial [Rhodospirillales bacterium]
DGRVATSMAAIDAPDRTARQAENTTMRLFSILTLVVLAVLFGGAAFLAVWEPRAPTKVIERTIPDDKLPR